MVINHDYEHTLAAYIILYIPPPKKQLIPSLLWTFGSKPMRLVTSPLVFSRSIRPLVERVSDLGEGWNRWQVELWVKHSSWDHSRDTWVYPFSYPLYRAYFRDFP